MVRSCEQTAVSKVYCTSIDSVSYSDTSLTKVSICEVVGQSKSTMYSWGKKQNSGHECQYEIFDLSIRMLQPTTSSICSYNCLLLFHFFPFFLLSFFVLPHRVTMLKLYSIGFCQGLLHQTTVRSEPVGCDQTFLR